MNTNSIPVYSGRPTLYLDQNILDCFVKNGVSNFGQGLRDGFQIVYSDETLKEIRRSVGYENKFLSVLQGLNSYHLKVVVEQPGFIITDKATITKRNVFEAFEEYCASNDYEYVEEAMSQWLLKFSGGRNGDKISDIHNEQLAAFERLMADMNENARELPDEMKSLIKKYSELMKEQFKLVSNDALNLMTKNIPNTEDWNGIKSFRESIALGPKELNNIKPPNVINKIWALIEEKLSEQSQMISLKDFFQIHTNPIYLGRPYHLHQKITAMYNMLNTIGYFPDSKIHIERRFVAAMSDTSHASMASFCDCLLSNDGSFVKKVRAIYEYLEVSTQVCLLEFE